tara:strand:+ start:344 stop:916 length:573 start_codon:yes stop_codon:yes gene_type:complete
MNEEFKDFFSKINQYNPEKDKKNYLDDVVSKIEKILPITNNIVFLCTHNSRRSQLCQVWGSILSKIYNIDLKFNSAGTEKTEVHKTIFYCFSNVGIEIKDSKIFYGDLSLSLHSKVLEEIQSDKFISIMTCSDAEKSCPSDSRSIRNISMIYQDPKIFDDTEKEREEYSKTSKLIAEELNYIIKNLVNSI